MDVVSRNESCIIINRDSTLLFADPERQLFNLTRRFVTGLQQ
jgi:hypothetical protein